MKKLYDFKADLFVDDDCILLVPAMKGLVLSQSSQTGGIININFNSTQHNLFFYNEKDKTFSKMPSTLKKTLVEALSHDGQIVIDATDSCKFMILNCRLQCICRFKLISKFYV